MWSGHTSTEAFKNHKLLQPTDPEVAKLGIKPIMPDQIVHTKHQELDEDDEDHITQSVTKGMNGLGEGRGIDRGVRTGVHWFEVLPTNQVQGQLIKISVK